MELTTHEATAKRRRTQGREKAQIPQETMLEVLLWLDRFDLDGKQITTRRLRSLVENNQMPLRKVERVDYDGEELRHSDPTVENNTLNIILKEDEEGGLANVEFQIDTDAHKAASYLSSCFVRYLNVYGHRSALPRKQIIAAPALIQDLDFRNCNFDNGEEDTLSETLDGSTFRCLLLAYSNNPVWQIDDKRLELLRLRGCNQIWVAGPDSLEPYDDMSKFNVTEEGILRYCFIVDGHLPMPERRGLRISWAAITPGFFQKASKNSQLTCDVELYLEHLRFDVVKLDVCVPPMRSQPVYDRDDAAHLHNVRYNIADHGNGIRLVIHFKSRDGDEWEVSVRHGKKDREEYFKPAPDGEVEYSPDIEYLEHQP